jgi:hypothetical protein
MRRKLALVACIALVALAVPSAPAGAAGAVVGQCSVTINPWPGVGSNAPCVGSAFGAFQAGAANVICSPCSLNASIDNYAEECFTGEPPLIGDAAGTLTISNGAREITPSYEWTRVGAVAVFTLAGPSGAGLAAFVPVDTTIPSCAAPGALDAAIVGFAPFI